MVFRTKPNLSDSYVVLYIRIGYRARCILRSAVCRKQPSSSSAIRSRDQNAKNIVILNDYLSK